MRQADEAALAARGRALPQGQELIYISKPTPTSQRWVFQGSGPVLLSYAEALNHIQAVETASIPCEGTVGHLMPEEHGWIRCETCGHFWDYGARLAWKPGHSMGNLPPHRRAVDS